MALTPLPLQRALQKKDGMFWRMQGEKKALRLFHEAAARVPAYKDFLKRNHVDPARVRTIRDFAAVPPADAQNYVAAYPLEKRCWDGSMMAARLIAASSGTKGEPKFWPRSAEQDLEAVLVHELLYRTYFNIDKRSTLLLIGFPMGVYVSGVATLLPSWLASLRGYRMTVMSVGNNKAEMLRAVRSLSASYEQTILIGHPFFIKDVIETGAEEGIQWAQKHLGLMFCSEGVSEQWREYLRQKAGIPVSAMRVFNTYGCSEFLLIGYETPFTIALRKTLKDGAAAPNIFQYNPVHRFIEAEGQELLFTVASGIPLIRYNLKDRGGTMSFEEAAGMRSAGGKTAQWQLPLVTLAGRSDHAVVFYAANIYPEHIRAGLSAPAFFKKLTGKFTMRKDYLRNMDEFLEVNIELRPGVAPSRVLAAALRRHVLGRLEKVNMEYDFLRHNLDKDIVPQIKLWPYGDAKYFKPGLKPRYILHENG